MKCPTCGSADVEPLAKGSAPYPSAIVAIFGVGLASLHQLSWPVDYRCAKCGSAFRKRTIPARAVGFMLIVLMAFVALGFIGMILKIIATRVEP
jgi:DMSO/TMAO reductase YedYZ heme-binding membrane subunit